MKINNTSSSPETFRVVAFVSSKALQEIHNTSFFFKIHDSSSSPNSQTPRRPYGKVNNTSSEQESFSYDSFLTQGLTTKYIAQVATQGTWYIIES